MKYKYILFDLDGTITESGPGIMNSVEYALNKMNREVGERDTLKKFIGPPLTESMEKYYGMSEEEALLGVKYYREYYAVKGIFENSVYEGLAETLESLKNEGYILAVATSKPEEYAKRIADKFDFAKYFAGIYGATMDGSLIRKADVIRYALDNLGVERKNYDQVRYGSVTEIMISTVQRRMGPGDRCPVWIRRSCGASKCRCRLHCKDAGRDCTNHRKM